MDKNKFEMFDYRIAKEKAILNNLIDKYPFVYHPKVMVSTNTKTGYSWNLPLITCRHATILCMEKCYALRYFMTTKHVITATMKRFLFLNLLSIKQLVDSISGVIPWGINSFRINGYGDLTEKSVEMFNGISKKRDDIKFYCYSRDPLLLNKMNSRISRILSIDNFSLEKINYIDKDIKITYLKDKKGEFIPNYVDLIHTVNSKKSLLDNDSRYCSFSKDKKATCAQCRKCFSSPKSNVKFG